MKRTPKRLGIPFIAPTVRKGDLVYPLGLDPKEDAERFDGYTDLERDSAYRDGYRIEWGSLGWADWPQIIPVTP